MSFKNWFLKPEENEAPSSETKVPEAVSVQPTAPTISTSVNLNSPLQAALQGLVEERFVKMLEQAMEEQNLPGQDYMEFKAAIEKMKGLPMDEPMMFKTVFTVISLQGCTKENLLASIDHYLSVIEKEKTQFDEELAFEREASITQKQKQIAQIQTEVESFQTKIDEMKARAFALSQESQQAEMKIRSTEANFNESMRVVRSVLESDKNKINTFLQ